MQLIIEGIDHCGKDTIIKLLQATYGGISLHSGKPIEYADWYHNTQEFKEASEQILAQRFLECKAFEDDPLNEPYAKPFTNVELFDMARKCERYAYQCDYYRTCFKTMKAYRDILETNVYYNRFHLGEYVYGKLYRNYTYDMQNKVFEIEKNILFSHGETSTDNWLHMFLFMMHRPDIRLEDTDAYSMINGEEEQRLFMEAYEKSNISKSIIYTDDIDGNWRSIKDIYEEICDYINTSGLETKKPC